MTNFPEANNRAWRAFIEEAQEQTGDMSRESFDAGWDCGLDMIYLAIGYVALEAEEGPLPNDYELGQHFGEPVTVGEVRNMLQRYNPENYLHSLA